jgi:hypothetical protein
MFGQYFPPYVEPRTSKESLDPPQFPAFGRQTSQNGVPPRGELIVHLDQSPRAASRIFGVYFAPTFEIS